ncbi:MAG TPA: AAA family ATPase [Terriglobales bacterium]
MTTRVHRTRFVIMAGMPGTGKTALAKALAKRLDGVVLSKDEVRAALFPRRAITYSSGQDDFCMSVVLMAAQRIAADHTVPFVFLDGRTFSRTLHVKRVTRAAASIGADLSILHLHCPESLALERIKQDTAKHPAKNRDPLLYFLVKSYFEPITLPQLDVDTSRSLDECVEECAAYLEGPHHGDTEDTEEGIR